MKSSKRRTLKKVFLNVCVFVLSIVYIGNVIANENAAQINSTLGIVTSKTVNKDGSPVNPDDFTRYYTSNFTSIKDLKQAGLEKVREVEGEGAVLLKNNGALPLAPGDVSLFGATSISPVFGGTGSGAVSSADAPKWVDAFTNGGFNVINTALLDWYTAEQYGRDFAKGDINEASWKKITKSDAADSFGKGETAVFIIGRVGGEAADLRSVEHNDGLNGDYLTANKQERQILEGLKGLKDEGRIKNIVLLINSANPISSEFINDEKYGIDAALWVGSLGQTGIYAVADILSGKVNPSGSLPDTWYQDNLLCPAMSNFGSYGYENADKDMSNYFTKYVVYQEGIYVGYRYTETRYEDKVLGAENVGDFDYGSVVAYPFGYGMSYTSFSMDGMKVTSSGEGMEKQYTVTVDVTNTGDVAGKKAVQIYAQKPYTDYDRENQIEKASVELMGYGKTQLLQPGEKETVTVSFPEYFLTSYDALGTGVFILDEGDYYFTAADNAHQAANNILAAKGMTEENGMDGEGNSALVHTEKYGFDSTTYALSYGTGAEVKSLFANADINRYDGRVSNHVDYITRSNWEGTVMLFHHAGDDDEAANDNYVKLAWTDRIKADVVLTDDDLPINDDNWPRMGSKDTSLRLIDLLENEDGTPIPYDDPKWEDLLDQMTYGQMSKLCAVGLRMTVAIEEIGKPETVDHNGPSGVTQKYSIGGNGYAVKNNDPDKDKTGTCYPCNGIIAATMNDQLVSEVGDLIGEDAMWAGYAGFYGTGVNIHRTPYAGRVFEYYSEDGNLTGLIAAKETAGIQSKGVYVYNKHFALNDQEQQRPGISTWCNEQALREIYLRAFELPIVMSDAKCVMTAFNRIGTIWAGASYPLLTEWLRGEAGMSGFAVTDMYDGIYMSKPHEVLAGNDIPDNYPGTTGTGTSADTDAEGLGNEFAAYGKNGTRPTAQIAQALRTSSHRLLYTVLHSRGMDGISADTEIVSVTPWWQLCLDITRDVFYVLTPIAAILMVLEISGISEKLAQKRKAKKKA